LVVTVSVDWEGKEFSAANVQAMNTLRNAHPNIPFVQFLNAAYYTKQGANPDSITPLIKSMLRSQDEHALHVHSWKSLIEASGVVYSPEPSLIGDNESYCQNDCGFSVPLEIYSVDEISRVVSLSSNILISEGFNRPKSFRAGAWMAGGKVREALAINSFQFDSSAVSWEPLSSHYRFDTLFKNLVHQFWPNTNLTSQPYVLKTNAGNLIEMPDNGCLADYQSANEMLKTFHANVVEWKKNPNTTSYVHFGLHLESANRFAENMNAALAKIVNYATENKLPLEFKTFEQIGSDFLN
jgi:hypothetical protein